MPSILELQHSLSILYQPVYGVLAETPGLIDLSTVLPDSFTHASGRAFPHVTTMFGPNEVLLGTITDNAPIDFVSWSIVGQLESVDIFAKCSLFFTHI